MVTGKMKRAKCEICKRPTEGGNVCAEHDRELGGPEQREFMRQVKQRQIDRENGKVDDKDDPFRPGNRLEGWLQRPS